MSEKGFGLKRDPSLGLLVVIGGPGGSGSSTISRLVAQRYGLTRHYAGGMFRQIAKEEGRTDFKEFLDEIEKKKGQDYDLEVDNRLIQMSQTPNVLIEAKAFAGLATIRNIPCTIKIWIDADIEVRVRRVLARESILDYGNPVPESLQGEYARAKADILERWEILRKRLEFLYGIDYANYGQYNDLVVNSTNQTVEETFNLICQKIDEVVNRGVETKQKAIEGSAQTGNTTDSMDDLEVDWRRWKCLVCGYVYEGTDITLKCPKCGNEDADKFEDLD